MSVYEEMRRALDELIVPELRAIRGDLRLVGEKLDALQAYFTAKIDRLEAGLMARLDALDGRPPLKDERGRCRPRGEHRRRRSEGR